jgi:prepilin-type N-terminal cleavage/methylation domain-containing protein
MKKSSHGFTIVELLIVIVVIAILAAISIVAYNGIQTRARETTLKSDLSNAAKQMELAYADNSNYPNTLPSDVKVSSNIVLSLSQASTGFCINGEYKNSTLRWRYESSAGGIRDGLCPGAVLSGSESGTNPNLITDTNFSQVGLTTDGNWYIGRSTGSTAGFTRNGTSSDPYPSRKVLQLSNTPNSSTTWSLIGGPYVNTGIVQGKTYLASYYVRLASGSVSNNPISYFGVQHGSATNTAIAVNSSGISPSSQWQQITRSIVASQNSMNGNIIYLTLVGTAVRDNTFTLEFQGFELREQ